MSSLPQTFGRYCRLCVRCLEFGIPDFFRYLDARRRGASRPAPYPLSCRHLSRPVLVRPGASDIRVFTQIFVHREYRCLDFVRDPGVIVDCGANVGYSAAYFLSRFPRAEVLCFEPDAGNFGALVENVKPYGSRCSTFNAAIWSRPAELQVVNDFRDGLEWSRSVKPSLGAGDQTVSGIDLSTVVKNLDGRRISILKIDIEGAETEVFGAGVEQWLDAVDTIVIELHGPECEAIFRRAIPSGDWVISTCDELTVCRRRNRTEQRR